MKKFVKIDIRIYNGNVRDNILFGAEFDKTLVRTFLCPKNGTQTMVALISKAVSTGTARSKKC
jgi:hypothetical protein